MEKGPKGRQGFVSVEGAAAAGQAIIKSFQINARLPFLGRRILSVETSC